MQRWWITGLISGVLMLVGGCQLMVSQVTKVDLRLIAKADINPDDHGRPSPLVVRILELGSHQSFANADFFSLYQDDKQTLGDALVATEEIELKPGDIRDLKIALQPGSQLLGVVAAYRQLEQANWRLVVPVQLQTHNRITLLLGARGAALASD